MDKEIPLQGCPVPSCDNEVDLAILTDQPTKLTTQNLAHDRVCLAPGTHQDGVIIVYHDEIEGVEPDQPTAEDMVGDRTEPEDPANPTEAEIDDAIDDIREGDGEHNEAVADAIDSARGPMEAPEAVELTGTTATVYAKLYEALQSESSITLAELGGRCLDADIPPSEVKETAARLVEQGYVAENEDAVYTPPA